MISFINAHSKFEIEPVASYSLVESDTEAEDDNSGDEERLHSRDW